MTQIRWGVAERDEAGELLGFKFTPEEEERLPVEIARILGEAGFTHVDAFAPEFADVQFAVSQKYRREPGSWPLFQSGLGVFTINQANEGYTWSEYKSAVLQGIDCLSGALRAFYDQVPFIGIELMYIDGFYMDEGQKPYRFLRKKFALKPNVPKAFLNAPFLGRREPSSVSLSLELEINDPVGTLTLSLDHAEIYGRGGYVMDTRVRSVSNEVAYSWDTLSDWLEAAHVVQQHAFRTLVEPDYLKSFE